MRKARKREEFLKRTGDHSGGGRLKDRGRNMTGKKEERAAGARARQREATESWGGGWNGSQEKDVKRGHMVRAASTRATVDFVIEMGEGGGPRRPERSCADQAPGI